MKEQIKKLNRVRTEAMLNEVIDYLKTQAATLKNSYEEGLSPIMWGLHIYYNLFPTLFSLSAEAKVKLESFLKEIIVLKHTDITTPDSEGNTPLHLILKQKDKALAALILMRHVSVNVQNNEGQTPFHLKEVLQEKDFREYMLHRGIDISLKDKKGKTVLDYAAEVMTSSEVALMKEKAKHFQEVEGLGKDFLIILATVALYEKDISLKEMEEMYNRYLAEYYSQKELTVIEKQQLHTLINRIYELVSDERDQCSTFDEVFLKHVLHKVWQPYTRIVQLFFPTYAELSESALLKAKKEIYSSLQDYLKGKADIPSFTMATHTKPDTRVSTERLTEKGKKAIAKIFSRKSNR